MHTFLNRFRNLFLIVVLFFSVVFAATAQAQSPPAPPATILRVDGIAGSPTGNGSAWSTSAYKYLQDAIDHANDPLVAKPVDIWVRGGTSYRPDEANAGHTPNARTETFILDNDVRWYGGFAGNETGTGAFNARRPATNITILTGAINQSTDADNSYHVVTGVNVIETCIIDGFTITKGNAAGAPSVTTIPFGYVLDAQGGGGMFLYNNNDSPAQVRAVILRCRFDDNEAVNGGAALFYGYPEGNGPHFRNCIFVNNHASANGGAYYNAGRGEPCPTEESLGGDNGGSGFLDCLFTDNVAANVGGALYCDKRGGLGLVNCTITRNTAQQSGTGDWGSGIFHENNCELGQSTSFANGILWHNGDGSLGEQITGNKNVQSSCVENISAGAGNISTDPQFRNALGPDTLPGTSDDDFRLVIASPCINVADSALVLTIDDQFDLNFNGYIYEDSPDLKIENRATRCLPDMGAYEFAPDCPGDANQLVNPVLGVNVDDLLAVINHWGPCPAAPTPCIGDISQHSCVVNVDDLMLVINNWGCGGSDPDPMPASVGDCMDVATENCTIFSEEWINCVNKCVEGLCASQVIDCD